MYRQHPVYVKKRVVGKSEFSEQLKTFINRYKVIVCNVAVIDTVLFCEFVYHLTLLQSPGRALVHDYSLSGYFHFQWLGRLCSLIVVFPVYIGIYFLQPCMQIVGRYFRIYF